MCENERLKYIWLFVCSQQLYTIKTFALKTHKYQYTSLFANSLFPVVFFFPPSSSSPPSIPPLPSEFCCILFRGFFFRINFIYIFRPRTRLLMPGILLIHSSENHPDVLNEFENTSRNYIYVIYSSLLNGVFAITKYKTTLVILWME